MQFSKWLVIRDVKNIVFFTFFPCSLRVFGCYINAMSNRQKFILLKSVIPTKTYARISGIDYT